MKKHHEKTGKTYDANKAEKRLDRMMKKFDANNDGQLAQSEMPQHGERLFEKLDTDKDGKISKAEADAMKKKHGKKHKEDHEDTSEG